MAMQFEYDDKGTTFYYFLLSFFAMFLLPATYYWFPDNSKKKDKDDKRKPCYCPPCTAKHGSLTKKEPGKKITKLIVRAVLVLLWGLLIAGIVKVSQFEKEFNEYNPYDVLKLEPGATAKEIKKQYRVLSLELHPDRGGDEKEFMKVAKAYQALTDEESKENWDKYGNPDGPGATQFGIALPSWIVDKKNSMWVLGAYLVAFIIILPIVVGTWWYRSIQYSADEVLMDTDQLYWYFFHKTPNMSIKRVIMILAGSMEFEKGHNNNVQERPSDNVELPMLMRELAQLNEKNKERPLCYPYSVKARALLHAHFSRIALPQETLLKDLELILKKCPYLIKEMINVVGQLIALGKAGRVLKPPRLETLENLMKLSQMIVQGVWDCKSAFLMLPHISQEHLRHFHTKKRHIKSIRELVGMKNEERRLLLRTLSDEQYQDIINVCSSFPSLDIEVKVKVIDDEDMHLVTAGSIITAVVKLKRTPLGDFFEDETVSELSVEIANVDDEPPDSPKPAKAWQRKVKKSKGNKKVKKPTNKKTKKPEEEKKEEEKVEKKKEKKSKSKKNADDGENTGDSDYEFNGVDEIEESGDDEYEDNNEQEPSVDENEGSKDEWSKIKDDDLIQPEKLLELKSKESHVVHCPYFPMEKHEYWWVFIVNKKSGTLLTPPQQVTNLKNEEEVQLKFTAPDKPGAYIYTVVVRSDSYVDLDNAKTFKVNVTEAKEFDPGAHWDYSSDDENKDESGESVYETEEEGEAGEEEKEEEDDDDDDDESADE
ncbi:translocation protein SEC63 homolog isoform X2 [Hydra vulgaris]|uniref:Translocation protein SEC63 homolog isoform X2 n=1 Tax=Hydra vulgaris TaxID=6087 RepID=A0ABM4BI97_HYDVU